MSIGQELLNVPMGEMIRDMALAIAEAQVALDAASLKVAEMMSGSMLELNAQGEPITGDDNPRDTRVFFRNAEGKAEKLSMIELGFSPTFYQFVDTIIEVKIAIRITTNQEWNTTTSSTTETKSKDGFLFFSNNNTVQTTQVDGSYTSKYGYSAEGASLLRTKLVPVPPPAILEERIRGLLNANTTNNDDE